MTAEVAARLWEVNAHLEDFALEVSALAQRVVAAEQSARRAGRDPDE